jgi:hypothetical protein
MSDTLSDTLYGNPHQMSGWVKFRVKFRLICTGRSFGNYVSNAIADKAVTEDKAATEDKAVTEDKSATEDEDATEDKAVTEDKSATEYEDATEDEFEVISTEQVENQASAEAAAKAIAVAAAAEAVAIAAVSTASAAAAKAITDHSNLLPDSRRSQKDSIKYILNSIKENQFLIKGCHNLYKKLIRSHNDKNAEDFRINLKVLQAYITARIFEKELDDITSH